MILILVIRHGNGKGFKEMNFSIFDFFVLFCLFFFVFFC